MPDAPTRNDVVAGRLGELELPAALGATAVEEPPEPAERHPRPDGSGTPDRLLHRIGHLIVVTNTEKIATTSSERCAIFSS
jgi:hypothetical protein